VSDGPSEPSKRMLGILNLLAFQGKIRLYEGPANRRAVARRHAKAKVAKQSRKVNRGR
jgi:hypothetical protein